MHLVIYYQKQIELKNTTLNLIRVKIYDLICNFNCDLSNLELKKDSSFKCMYYARIQKVLPEGVHL